MIRLRRGVVPRTIAILAMIGVAGCEARIDTLGPPGGTRVRPDLTVTVYDNSTGHVIVGASVRLYEKVSNGAVYVATQVSGSDGKVTFVQPAQGEYLMYASATGYVGVSWFASVGTGSVLAPDLRLTPVSQLPDVSQTLIPAIGGSVATVDIPGVNQSTVTFGPGTLPDNTTVTIATLQGSQIPVPPRGQIAVSAVLVDASQSMTGTATLSLGLPFDLPDGQQVPVYVWDDATSSWHQLATGTVTNGQVVANIESLGSLAALATFLPRRSTVVPDVTTSQRVLGPSDGSEIITTYVPTLGFPSNTNYTDKTKAWIRGSLEQLLGLTFGSPVTVRLKRDPNATQTLTVVRHVDLYTLTVEFPSGRPSRVTLIMTTSIDFFGQVTTQSTTVNDVHTSGFGTGG